MDIMVVKETMSTTVVTESATSSPITIETIRGILREYGLSLNIFRRTMQRGLVTYLSAVRDDGQGHFQCYLGLFEVISRMDKKTLEQHIEAKCKAKLLGAYTWQCAKSDCMKRSKQCNKATLSLPLGNFIAYLCDGCFKEYEEVLDGQRV